MPDTLDISADVLPDIGLLTALAGAHAPAERLSLIKRLRQRVEYGRGILRERLDQQSKLYEEIVCGRQSLQDVIQQLARIAGEWRRSADEHRRLREAFMREIKNLPSTRDADILPLVEEILRIADQLVAVYPTFRTRLLELASERGEIIEEKYRARPIQGEVDHAGLSREFIERFPKIRARLAE